MSRPTVVIVAWRSGPFLRGCLEALRETEGGPPAAIVVDNACPDRSTEGLDAAYPGLRILTNSRNVGFAAGANIGMRAALDGGATDVVLLNPDARPEKEWLLRLGQAALARRDAGLLGSLLATETGMALDPYQDRMLASTSPQVDRTWPFGGEDPIEVPAAIGASLWIRRDVLHEVGGFDPAFFTYGEEMDLCRRARERGFAVLLVPRSRVRHAGEGSSRTQLLRWRNRWLRGRNDGLLFLKRPRVRVAVSAAELPARVARLVRQDLRDGEPMTALLRVASIPRVIAAVPRLRRTRDIEAQPWAHLRSPAGTPTARDRADMSGVTRFFRNPVQLASLFEQAFPAAPRPPRVAVHACSTGAEPYTLAIEAARRSVPLEIDAFDRDPRYVAAARRGLYRAADVESAERAAGVDLAPFFERTDAGLRVASEIRRRLRFAIVDVQNDEDVERQGSYDVVLCQNALVHMEPRAEEDVLRRLANTVRPGGWLVVAGRSLDSGAILESLGFDPLTDKAAEIHDAWIERRQPFDDAVRDGLPPPYWALAPFDATVTDWRYRFGSLFRKRAT